MQANKPAEPASKSDCFSARPTIPPFLSWLTRRTLLHTLAPDIAFCSPPWNLHFQWRAVELASPLGAPRGVWAGGEVHPLPAPELCPAKLLSGCPSSPLRLGGSPRSQIWGGRAPPPVCNQREMQMPPEVTFPFPSSLHLLFFLLFTGPRN